MRDQFGLSFLQGVRQKQVVRVQPVQKPSFCLAKPFVECVTLPAVFFRAPPGDSILEAADHVHTVIRAAPVHDNQLEILTILRQHGFDGQRQIQPVVVIGNNNRKERCIEHGLFLKRSNFVHREDAKAAKVNKIVVIAPEISRL